MLAAFLGIAWHNIAPQVVDVLAGGMADQLAGAPNGAAVNYRSAMPAAALQQKSVVVDGDSKKIPPRVPRSGPDKCASKRWRAFEAFALYCERNLIERFFNKIKHFRGIATRYDKLARNYLATVQLVATIILLN
jgi:hypothetical protein